uniref:Secreted protein n=2 Tax=Picea TaxID=3328 RepID=A0A124GNK5_PICGL|nr:hypothetical protein ABT39_MTgene3650 [Picea glauca]QHR89811.1 hypothetical protein Q903MT_gene3833 [Picea sitchensis]
MYSLSSLFFLLSEVSSREAPPNQFVISSVSSVSNENYFRNGSKMKNLSWVFMSFEAHQMGIRLGCS